MMGTRAIVWGNLKIQEYLLGGRPDWIPKSQKSPMARWILAFAPAWQPAGRNYQQSLILAFNTTRSTSGVGGGGVDQ